MIDKQTTEYQPQSQGRLVSYSRPAPGIEPTHFLHLAKGHERFYWRAGRAGHTCAGMGVAADLMAWGENRFQSIERQASALFEHAVLLNPDMTEAMPRLFGGFAFRDDFTPDNTWAGFNPAHFVLPHYQLVCHGDECWLTINALLPLDEDPAANLSQLAQALDARYDILCEKQPTKSKKSSAANYVLSYPMSYETWAEMIHAAHDRFQAQALEKTVLARVCEARLEADRNEVVDTDAALNYLIDQYADCYTFLFEPRPAHTFMGATPELLVSVEVDQLSTMGLAGSIQRGATSAEDEQLAQALLSSTKDCYEHDLVVQAMRQRLTPLTATLDVPSEPSIYQLSNIQHLYTPITGRLHSTAGGVLPLVETLHPTPALGGAPRAKALQFIREHEPVPRGWYAAPIGWIDYEMNGMFGVAIRSAVVRRQRVWLYAGAGIVAASQPALEWEETGWKFRPILEALGIS